MRADIPVSKNETYSEIPGSLNKYQVAKIMRDTENSTPSSDFLVNNISWKKRQKQREQWRNRQFKKKQSKLTKEALIIIKKAAMCVYRVKRSGSVADKVNELMKGYKWGITLPDGSYKIAPTESEQEALDWSKWQDYSDAPEGSMKDKKTGTCVDVANHILKNIPDSSCVLRADSEDPEAFHITPIIKDDDGKYTYVRQHYGSDNYVSDKKADNIPDLVDKMTLPDKAFDGETFHYYPLRIIPKHKNLGELLKFVKVMCNPLKKVCRK